MDGNDHGIVGIAFGHVVHADESAWTPDAPSASKLLKHRTLRRLLGDGQNLTRATSRTCLIGFAIDSTNRDVACDDASDRVGRHFYLDGGAQTIGRDGLRQLHVDGIRLHASRTDGVVDACDGVLAQRCDRHFNLSRVAQHDNRLCEVVHRSTVAWEVVGQRHRFHSCVDHGARFGVDEHGYHAEFVQVLCQRVAGQGERRGVFLCGTVHDGRLNAVGNAVGNALRSDGNVVERHVNILFLVNPILQVFVVGILLAARIVVVLPPVSGITRQAVGQQYVGQGIGSLVAVVSEHHIRGHVDASIGGQFEVAKLYRCLGWRLVALGNEVADAERSLRLAHIRVGSDAPVHHGIGITGCFDAIANGHWVVAMDGYGHHFVSHLLVKHVESCDSTRTPAAPSASEFLHQRALGRELR